MSRCFAKLLMMDLSRKESYQGHTFEHVKGNKLFIEVNVDGNGILQQEDYGSNYIKLK